MTASLCVKSEEQRPPGVLLKMRDSFCLRTDKAPPPQREAPGLFETTNQVQTELFPDAWSTGYEVSRLRTINYVKYKEIKFKKFTKTVSCLNKRKPVLITLALAFKVFSWDSSRREKVV